jgi:hypothetical protein
MGKKEIILIILCLCLVLGAFLGYSKWHYESANAFYLSHKRGESLYKQQKALIKSVNPKVMKELGIEVITKEKSSELYAIKKIEDGISYSFQPEIDGGTVIVFVAKVIDKDHLCSFWFGKNLDDTSTIVSNINEDQTIIYKKNAIKIYKKLFKDVYDNWEIQ